MIIAAKLHFAVTRPQIHVVSPQNTLEEMRNWGWDNVFESLFVTFSYYVETSSINTLTYLWKYRPIYCHIYWQIYEIQLWKHKKSVKEYLAIKMFIFGNFVQKFEFEWSQFQKVKLALPEFHFVFFHCEKKSCFQSSKSCVGRTFWPLRCSFMLILHKNSEF